MREAKVKLATERVVACRAMVVADSEAGRREHPCWVKGETRTRYRIVALACIRLQGKKVGVGCETLVSKRDVRFNGVEQLANAVMPAETEFQSPPEGGPKRTMT